MVILIATTIYQSKKVMPDGRAVLQFAGWGLLLLLLASLIWWLFESRTAFVRSKVSTLPNLGRNFMLNILEHFDA